MIPVPVLAPSAHLQRAEPPDVLAGVAIRVLAEMGEAVDEALHVQRVDEADCADPEKAGPPEQRSAEDGNDDHGDFGARPKLVDSASELGAILHLVSGLRLVEPAQVRPPEATMGRAGDVLGAVRIDVVMAMVCDPAARCS